MNKQRWLILIGLLAALLAVTPAYVGSYRVFGPSDAPSFRVGERIVVNKAAYDLRLPYTGVVLFSHSMPERGDVVMFRAPGQDYLVFKRVIGCPGDRVAMSDYHLQVNGNPLRYERVDATQFQSIAVRNQLGAVVEEETGNGPAHWISFTPGLGPQASFEPVVVPERQYFVLGDNRGNSEDSRNYGSVSRPTIHGRVIR